jgi:hypothetical protein
MKAMKKIIYNSLGIFLLVFAGGSLFSCAGYIDVDEYFYDQLSLDSAFAKRQYVDGWLSNLYQHVGSDVGEMENDFKYASDDLIKRHDRIKALQNCNYSASNSEGQDKLGRLYETVRKASTFIVNVDKCRDMTLSEISDYKAQARFARAYAYWTLIRRYGPVPFIPVEGLNVNLSYEELSLPRTHFDEIVDFINEELELAAVNLPSTRTVNNLGRPTKGAALALRARVLLFAASPLFNGNKDLFNVRNLDGTQLVSQEYDETKWARAAAAAKELIDMDRYELYITSPMADAKPYERPPYHPEYSDKAYPDGWANVDPYVSYKSNFDGTILGSKNPELIFTRTNQGGTINTIVREGMPLTLGGSNILGVSQKMVDAYYMNDGRTIQEATQTGDYQELGFTTTNDPESPGGAYRLGADVSLQYANREPRFYASIAFSGSIWECESANESRYRNQQIFYYRGLNDGKQSFREEGAPTGISIKKYYNREDALTQGGYQTQKTEPTIRYAEMLLIYAEALNELTPGTTYDIESYHGQTTTVQYSPEEMQYAMKRVRIRAGLPDFSSSEYNNREQFRQRIKRERQIELFAENAMRYYDLRRWKDAPVEENQALMGCNVNITDDDTRKQQFYRPTIVSSIPKVFLDKMYLWPFPTAELKRNVNLTQNPGW